MRTPDEQTDDGTKVQMQDVEHQPHEETRVNNAGVKVIPARNDERRAKVVLEEFDRGVMRGRIPR